MLKTSIEIARPITLHSLANSVISPKPKILSEYAVMFKVMAEVLEVTRDMDAPILRRI